MAERVGMTPQELARAFHEAYERLAPSFGYETRKASAVPWEDVPEPNWSLMIAVVGEVLGGRLAALERENARLREALEWTAMPTAAPEWNDLGAMQAIMRKIEAGAREALESERG